MLIEINTDTNIEGDNTLTQQVKDMVSNALDHYSEHITRIEVYLSDENSDKKTGINDMRCLLEVTLTGLEPVVVSHQAETIAQAVDGAADRMKRSLTSALKESASH